jgi:hypothetical protein
MLPDLRRLRSVCPHMLPLFVVLLLAAPAVAETVPAPFLHWEPDYTVHEPYAGGWRWNWVEWDQVSGSGIIYKVQCLLGDPPYSTPVVFAEPNATRGDYNTVFVGGGVLREQPFSAQLTNTEFSFMYPFGWEGRWFLLHGRNLTYRVMAAVQGDTVGTASDWSNLVLSTQDHEAPWIDPGSLTLPDIHGGTQGDVAGSINISDGTAGVYEVWFEYRWGLGGAWQGGSITAGTPPSYDFVLPEPPGGWGSLAGDYVGMKFAAVDAAALPEQSSPQGDGNYWEQELGEFVEGAGGSPIPPEAVRRWGGTETPPRAGTSTAYAPGRTDFTVQCSADPSFPAGSTQEQTAFSSDGFAECTFGGLSHGTRYYYRARVGMGAWSDTVGSWQDYYKPWFDGGTYQTDPPDLNEGSTGPLHAWIEIKDWPAGIGRAWGYYQRGSLDPSPQEFEMSNEGGDVWGFYVPEPPGAWADIAGEALTIELRAYDRAAPPDGWYADQDWETFYAPPDSIESVSPTVTLTVPNGGEQWSGTQTIVWTATDPDGPDQNLVIDLHFKRQGELFWTPIAAGLPNTGQYDWNTGQVPYDASDYLVRIRATDPDQYWDEDTSDSTFTIDNHGPNVELFVPNGGEWWFGTRDIRWYAADSMGASGESIFVDVGYKQDFQPFWNLLVQDLLVPSQGDTGAYSWNTDQVPEGDQYRVKVQARDHVNHIAADSSDGTFAINREDPPEVRVLFPNGGEILDGTVTIRWTATDPDTAYGDYLLMDVEFSPDGGGQWIGLQFGAPNTDSLAWNTAGLDDGNNYVIRVRGRDIHGLTTVDESDGPFTIFNHDRPPQVQLLYPNGGEQLEGVVQVQWDASDPDTTLGDSLLVDLEASPDSGDTWVGLVEDTQDDGTWSWNTTEMEDSPSYLLRITVRDIRDSTATDLSDSTFSIFNLNHAPVVDLIEPVGGEYWWGVRDIRWDAYDPDSLLGDTLVVSLWYSPDAGWQWLQLQDSIPDIGGWSWDTEEVSDDSLYMVKVQVWDITGETAIDYSDSTFVINQNEGPSLELLAPLGGEILEGDEYVRWSATDPDVPFGDMLAIDLHYSADGGGTWLPLSLDRPNTGSWLWDTTPFPDGLDYRLKAVVEDTAGLWASDSSGVFSIENYNLPPDAFHLVWPDSSEIVTVLRPDFLWTTAHDIDAGDRVHYTVMCDTAVTFASAAFWEAGGDTSLTAPDLLLDNTLYYWKVLATDSLGPDTTVSVEQGWWFVTNSGGLNDPPQEFSLIAPIPDSLLATLTPGFTWSASWDPDPLDWVEYRLYVDTLSSFATTRIESAGTDTSLTLSEPLVDNRKYFWKVAAFDPHGAVTWAEQGTWSFYTDTVNDLPAAFSLVRPESASVETQLSPLFLWTPSSDADPVDSLWYEVWLDTLADFSTAESFVSLDTSATVPWVLPSDDIRWYWKVSALDTRDGVTWSSELGWWFYLNTSNDPPHEFNLLEPDSGTIISGATPTFVWEVAFDSDPLDRITYTLWYDKHADFHTYKEVPGISDTRYTIPSPMRERGTVYWKVRATDLAGASVWSRQKDWWFVVPPQEMVEGFINYPNPFDPETGPTTLQYVLILPASIRIRIFDLTGTEVTSLRYDAGADGGAAGTNRVSWDGCDSRGNVVGNGGYLCLLEARFADGTTVEKHRKVAVLR